MPSTKPLTALSRVAAKSIAAIVKRARADIALVRKKKATIAAAFYDMGEAIVRLKNPQVCSALGHESFNALCEIELGMSVAQANRLIDIVENMTRREAAELGATRAAALVGLVEATPAHDTARGVLRRGVKLPGGKTLRIRGASVRAILDATKAVRRASGSKSARGRRVAAGDAAVGTALQRALRAEGVKGASVKVLAGMAGKPARMRIDGVLVGELRALGSAIRKVEVGR